jgi:probable rRNA maturation factor
MVIFRKRAAGLSEPALERFVARAKRALRVRGAVNVLVTTSRELRLLNRRFRGQDKATDVLSFPPVLGLLADFVGDVAISADIATQNARRLGHSVADEIRILALHGMLHLAGYDHERDSGVMARKEMLLRKKLGLPVGLIERGSEQVELGTNSFRAQSPPAEPGPLSQANRRAAGGGARSTPAKSSPQARPTRSGRSR